MNQLMKRHPSTGWIRADQVSEKQKDEIIRLHKKIEELEEKLKQSEQTVPNSCDWAFGSDTYDIEYHLEITEHEPIFDKEKIIYKKLYKLNLSWDNIFRIIAPSITTPIFINNIIENLNKYCGTNNDDPARKEYKQLREHREYSEKFIIKNGCFETIKIQFLCLDLIEESVNKNGYTFWKLSPRGKGYLLNNLGIRKPVTQTPESI